MFSDIKNSVHSPAFYQALREKPFSFSLKYFLKYLLILSLLATLYSAIVFVPKITDFLSYTVRAAINYYPEELVLTFKDGLVSTNVAEPYYLPWPPELTDQPDFSDYLGEEDSPQHLFVINTQAPFSIEQFKQYDTLIWITRTTIAHQDDDGKITLQPIPEEMALTIDHATIQQWGSIGLPLLDTWPAILLPILFFIACYLLLLLQLVYLLFGALAIWLLSKLTHLDLTYGKAYQIGLHALTLVIPLFLLLQHVLHLSPFRFSSTFLLLGIIWINLRRSPFHPIKDG